MQMLANILIGLIAFLHLYIFVFECFLWEKRGPKVFSSFPKELFAKTKALAFNQGVYNAFLAVGLIWSLLINDSTWSQNVATFFLLCVAVAGIAGAISAERKIIFVQTVPAVLALIFLWLQ